MASLKSLRKDAGLTQAEVAFILDVDPSTVARWERGETEPSVSMARRLAWILRTDEATLLEAVIGAKQAS